MTLTILKLRESERKCEECECYPRELQEQRRRTRGLTRRERNLVHGGVLLVVGVSLVVEGAKVADVGFLALSIICEVWA